MKNTDEIYFEYYFIAEKNHLTKQIFDLFIDRKMQYA